MVSLEDIVGGVLFGKMVVNDGADVLAADMDDAAGAPAVAGVA